MRPLQKRSSYPGLNRDTLDGGAKLSLSSVIRCLLMLKVISTRFLSFMRTLDCIVNVCCEIVDCRSWHPVQTIPMDGIYFLVMKFSTPSNVPATPITHNITVEVQWRGPNGSVKERDGGNVGTGVF